MKSRKKRSRLRGILVFNGSFKKLTPSSTEILKLTLDQGPKWAFCSKGGGKRLYFEIFRS